MSITIFPESGDQITESAWTTHNKSLTIAHRYRLNGFTVSAGSGLVPDIAAGTCYVNGYYINSDATQTVTVTASQTNYIWLNADGTLSHNTTGTNPGSELLVGIAVTDGSSVTSVTHDFNFENAYNAYVKKPSDETVNNSTTLQNDDDLKFTVQDGEQWEITCLLLLDTASSTPDFKFKWDISGGSLSQHNFVWGQSGAQWDAAYAAGEVVLDTGTGTDAPVILKSIVIVTTGGTLNLQWAQSTANASDSKVAANSILIARRVAG